MRTCLTFSLCAFFLVSTARAAEPDHAGVEFFENKVRPLLVEHCYSCHSVKGEKSRGGLLLDSKAATLKGGKHGPALVPGKPEQSLIVKAIRYDGETQMPPKGKLPEAAIKDLVKWIEMGAPDPREGNTAVARGIDWPAARKFWSFQPIRLPVIPGGKNATWAKTDIDRFILAKLEEKGLKPVGPAEKRALIRRATQDLIGLPPTPEEIDAFLKDESPDAFEKVIDRLLASKHYGERWGRHWLDVARYAEDQAHTFAVIPNTNAFRYRDWVIDAFNSDMPYDRFVKLQIAADLVDEGPEGYKQLAALGFFGLGAQYYKNTDAARAAADELDDRVDTLARGFLGLTVSCARCHDHKYDPIPTQDYYSLAGIFQSCKLANLPLAPKQESDRYQESQRRIAEADKKLKDFVKVEKSRVAEAKTAEVSAYLVSVWKWRAQKQEKPGFSTREQAKADNLNAAVLDRWVKFLDGKAPQGVAAFEAYRKLAMPAKGAAVEPTMEVTAAAKGVQEQIASVLQERERNKGKLDKAKNDLLNGLFGDNGVFALSDNELLAQLSAEKKKEHDALKTGFDQLKASAPPAPPIAHALAEASVTDMKVFIRGNPATQGDLAPRRFLRILTGDEPPKFTKGSGRLELAEAIASKDNPLTARVIVNRIWQFHFGRGIVGTPSNFGQLGERPTHPELLDYLAAKFITDGWSMKKLHREIMRSAVYRLSADHDPAGMQVDPDNRLLWHMNRRRLDIEAWRDSLLAASGQLDRTMGGPTTNLDSASNTRRTVYGKISRHELNGLLRLFDFPDANITSERRSETTVPQQQLFVLNSPFFLAQAKALAARVQKEGQEDAGRIRLVYALAYGRPPNEAEMQLGIAYLSGKDEPAEADRNKLTRWERYAQVLLASNEFMYID